MDKSKLTEDQRAIRMHIRNFLMVATAAELSAELEISLAKGDHFRAECIRELMAE